MKSIKAISIVLITVFVFLLFPSLAFADDPPPPTFSLAVDTGISDDNISSNGQINVSSLESGATWEYSANSGANWDIGSGTSFILADGTYTAGTIQVRQTVDGSTSTAASNTDTIVIAQNQIENGDFQSGYAGFFSQYSLGNCVSEGTYDVVMRADYAHPSWVPAYDHTYNSSLGEYFVANGSLVPGFTVWQSTTPDYGRCRSCVPF